MSKAATESQDRIGISNAVLLHICSSHRLCWPAQVCVGDAFGGFGVGFFDDVGVDIRGGGYGGMAEALRHGDDIRALIYEN